MRHKNTSPVATNWRTGLIAQLLSVMLLLAFFVNPLVVLAADEECDQAVSFTSPANDICVPALAVPTPAVDGVDTEWTAGTFVDAAPLQNGGTPGARARISRKATGIGKSDLYLFFDVSGDAVASNFDEIRIAVNPGTTAANSTLIKIHPFMGGAGTANFYNYPGAIPWTDNGTPGSWFAFHPTQNNGAATWTTEVKISLDQIPTHPITGTTFRLYLELIASDNVNNVSYQWPAHYGFVGTHDFVCSNPMRWRPVSFGTGCFPDLNIAGGAYSCGAIYIMRGGVKSTEYVVGDMNEIHADVTNPGPGNATGVKVYLDILRAGISTGPVAMNFDHNDASIRQFFNDKYGPWLTPTDKLDSGTPKPPTAFNVNGGATDTGARFNWRPSDETRFGAPADFIGTHKCTGAFVDFKDDPDFSNNLSYCNTSIVSCPSGVMCAIGFGLGALVAWRNPQAGGDILSRLVITAINAPPDFLKRSEFRLDGPGIKAVGENVYELSVPARGEVELKANLLPQRETQNTGSLGLMPTANAQTPPGTKDERGGSDLASALSDFMRKQYGNRPVIFIQGLAQTFRESKPGGGPEGFIPLSRPTNYVAFVIDTGGAGTTPTPTVTPTPGGSPGGCSCGRSTGTSFMFSSFFVMGGLALVWRRSRRRPKKARK